MKRVILSAALAIMILFAAGQSKISRVKLFANHEQLRALALQGLAIDHGVFKANVYVICELSETELAVVDENGIDYEIEIPDVTRFYIERNAPYMNDLDGIKRAVYDLSDEWPVPAGFELGTCGGFLTIDQAMEHLDSMAAQYPDLVSPRYTLEYSTHNGRQLYWVRISDNPEIDEEEPEVLYTGMHHAREPIGMQLLVFYMYYLLENYDTDPDVQYIVDNFELYFIPIINADGYAYNIQNNPNGGGNWRKNRKQNDDGSYGVDINRNYSYMWGLDDYGSSPDPESDTYRGTEAFSEPETKCVRDFCENHEFRIALNYHSYSNYLLYPWGWSADPCPDDPIFNFHSEILTQENGYLFGPGFTTIYPTNGGSDDWMYGEQSSKDMILSYTPEVGDGNAGFWPPVSQIIPLCQVNMHQNIYAALLAGPYATVSDLAPSIMEYESGLIFFELQRVGLEDGATYTVSIEPLNDAIATISAPLVYTDLDIFETVTAAFNYTLKDGIASGERVDYLLTVNNGLATFSDTISKIYGTPMVIFQDSASNFNKWNSAKWNITTLQYHSPTSSLADSPVGQYTNNENNSISLIESIDLTDAVYASLGFWAKWDIEYGYDYVQIFISDDNGSSWNPVEGKYTHTGNNNQAYGEPLYDGVQPDWVKEEINLEPFTDSQILIRFVLRSDTFVVGDGFFWDDMTVTIVEDLAIGIADESSKGSVGDHSSVKFIPNPASEIVMVDYNLNDAGPGTKSLKIFNQLGKQVFETGIESFAGKLKLDVAAWSPGIYFYTVSSNQTIIESGKLIVR